MKEAAIVFGSAGQTLYTHLPPDRSGYGLPDSRDLWQVLWMLRTIVAGVAHLHPWHGPAVPSAEPDLTTFSAVDRGLGMRLFWPVVTMNDFKVYRLAEQGAGYCLDISTAAHYYERVVDVALLRHLGGVE